MRILDNLSRRLRKKPKAEAPIAYEQARELAREGSPDVRRTLAVRPDLRPEILYFLANDPSAEVRRAIAANAATPAQANLRLASDIDPTVRGDLAQKIARLAPGLSANEQDRLRRLTYETLMLLARDQIPRVRQILAEALKDVANAPPDVIRQLAHDSVLAVSAPILEFSPVLTDEDLLQIILDPPAVGALPAISRRADVAPRVADAIARSEDVEAITALLRNPSAQIREETLDLLIGRAADHEAWHEPLVRRPHLPVRAATRLARLVADSLLQVLEQRSDFDQATKDAVATAVRRRVEEEGAPAQQAEGEARDDLGEVAEPDLLAALEAKDIEFVVSVLAARAGLSIPLVRKVAATQSAKGMTALAWKAGFSMAAAVQLQINLAKVPSGDVLKPRPGTRHAFPLDAGDMVWQIEFFAAMVGDKKVLGLDPSA